MTKRAELWKYLVCCVRNRIVASELFPVSSLRITAMIMPQNIIHVNIPQFRYRGEFHYRDEFRRRGEFRHRCWFRHRSEFRRRHASSRIPTFHPIATTQTRTCDTVVFP
jgi:hypothetical protein